MKKIDRLLWLQGNRCFFCAEPIPSGEASIEHLDPLSADGENSEENCVVCCKTLNSALGNKPLKEKIRVILLHRPNVRCPARAVAAPGRVADVVNRPAPACAPAPADIYLDCRDNLRKRTSGRPSTREALQNSLATLFAMPVTDQLDEVIRRLEQDGEIAIDGNRITYPQSETAATS